EKQGITFRTGAKVTGVEVSGKGTKRKAVVQVEGEDPVEADRVLVAVGRKPNTEGLGLEAGGVERDERGRVKSDAAFRTSAKGFYAIGDVVPGPMLAHKAEEDGVAGVEAIETGRGHVDYDTVPGIAYTEPEVATVGASEERLK